MFQLHKYPNIVVGLVVWWSSAAPSFLCNVGVKNAMDILMFVNYP
jgi:hypothetical protein